MSDDAAFEARLKRVYDRAYDAAKTIAQLESDKAELLAAMRLAFPVMNKPTYHHTACACLVCEAYALIAKHEAKP